ncbi:MAG: hypothetical protein ACJAXB_000992 [Candidatus Endobugula sp.]|jgi:hypothetical protein
MSKSLFLIFDFSCIWKRKNFFLLFFIASLCTLNLSGNKLYNPLSVGLQAGDIMFVAYTGDGDDGFAIVALVEISANSTIYFNDNEWNGLAINSGGAFNGATEGEMTWDTGGTEISAGTVITFNEIDNTSNTSFGASVGTLTGSTLLGASDEVLYAFVGTDSSTPTTFLSAVANDEFSVTNGPITNTGLTVGVNAVNIDGDEDVMAYSGSTVCDGTKVQCAAQVANLSNWITQDASGDQNQDATAPDFPDDVPASFTGSLFTPITEVSITITSTTNPDCYGESNGSLTATATPGEANYTYLWSNGLNSGSTSALTSTNGSLSAGTYTVTVTDTNGNTATASGTVTQPSALEASALVTSPISCNDASDGQVTASQTGGTEPYTYSWNNGGTAALETGLDAGTYTLTVTDANGCTDVTSVEITQPDVLGVSISEQTNVAINGESTGSVTAAGSGGTTPYTYSWNTGGTAAQETGLDAGTYTVSVTDGNGCGPTTTTVTITQSANRPPVITTSSAVSFLENETGTAYTVSSTDAESENVTYTLGTGNDEELFTMTAGVVTFNTPPDFEVPGGNNEDNTYVINVIASDGANSVNMNVTITVTNLDELAPTIISLDPVDGATISANQSLGVQFGELVFKGTGNISIVKASNGDLVQQIDVKSNAVSINGDAVTIDPPIDLPVGENLAVLFDGTSIVDASGNDITGIFTISTWNHTVTGDDLTAPRLVSLSPEDGSSAESLTFVTANFDEHVFANQGKMRIYRKSDLLLLRERDIHSHDIMINGSAVTLQLPANLTLGEEILIHFSASSLADGSGNEIGTIFGEDTWNLITVEDPSPTIVSLSPADGSGITQGATATVTFSENVFKQDGKVRIYKKSDLTLLKLIEIRSSLVRVNGAAVSIEMPSNLPVGEEIIIHFSSTSLVDSEGKKLGALFSADTWNLLPSFDPSPTINSLSPVDGSNTVGQATFTATFSETLTKGSGKLRIYKRSDFTLLSITNIASGSIVLTGSSLSFNLPKGLPLGEELLIHLSKNALLDGGDNSITGLFTADTWNFTVTFNPSMEVNAETTFVAPAPAPVSEQEAEVQLVFNIYPNPAEDQITIELSEYGHKEVAISIINQVGMSLYQKQGVTPFSHDVDVSSFSQGMYIVTIAHGEGFSRKKLMIRR